MRKLGLPLLPAPACLLVLALLSCVLGPAFAGAPPPAERARALEEVGRFAEAARLYALAIKEGNEGNAPPLLYRLALCKRHLGDYAGAREALRGYLREEPSGPLRVEVERQLAQLQVLIEERGLHPERAPHGGAKKAGAAAGSGSAPVTDSVAVVGTAPVTNSLPVAGSVSAAGHPAAAVSGSVLASDSAPASAPGSGFVPASAPAADAGVAAVPAVQPMASSAPGARSLAGLAPAPGAPAALPPAPATALSAAPVTTTSRAVAPLAAGALVAGLAGAVLLWDGARVSADLDARFASGDLTAADQSRYTRAHREGAFGVALVSLAVLTVGAAVWVGAF